MMWQIDHLKKRYINSNYILREIMMTLFNCYWFHAQNQYNWPLQSDAEVNRMRFFYWNYYIPIKDKVEPEVFKQLYIESANNRNIEQQGVIPKMTIHQFLDMLGEKQYEIRPDDDVDGSEPIHELYEDTPDDVPTTVHDYTNCIVKFFKNKNNNTNLARMDTMDRLIKEGKEKKFKDLRSVKNDKNYDKNGKRILKPYESDSTANAILNTDGVTQNLPYINPCKTDNGPADCSVISQANSASYNPNVITTAQSYSKNDKKE